MPPLWSLNPKHNILSPFQSGFWSNHSTTSALLKLTNNIFTASSVSKLTGTIFVHLTKALDLVEHYFLSDKLVAVLSCNALLWLNSYFYNRKNVWSYNEANLIYLSIATRCTPRLNSCFTSLFDFLLWPPLHLFWMLCSTLCRWHGNVHIMYTYVITCLDGIWLQKPHEILYCG